MILFIGLMVCPACKEEEEETYFRHKISANLYPLLFDEGSTWIYSNTGTFLFDTVVLTSVEIDTIVYGPSGPGEGSPGEEQVYILSFNSSQVGVYEKQLREDYICRSSAVGGQPYGVEYLSSHKTGDEFLGAEIVEIFDAYSVNENTYSNVVKMNVQDYDGTLPGGINLYYADYVGVVKNEIKENDSVIATWELIKYNVSFYEMNK
ncbi:MAG: hypothetical protein RBS07_06030 [Lentimicrobium sp.]|jgi:hypothetical protein|nr:hypothetical protein [Lentimicrobium sp.]